MHAQLTQHLLDARAMIDRGDIAGARALLRRESPITAPSQHVRWLEARIALRHGQFGVALSTLWTIDMRQFVPLTAADHKLVLLDELTAAMHCGAFHEAAQSAVTLMVHHGVIATPVEALTRMWSDGPTTYLEELLEDLPDSVKIAAAHHFSTLTPNRAVKKAVGRVLGHLLSAPRQQGSHPQDNTCAQQPSQHPTPQRQRVAVPAQRTPQGSVPASQSAL